MYSIGIFSNISELTTFPFSNIKTFAESNFLHKENYKFTLYTKEQKEIFLANVQTGVFDGIVFATNTANDSALKLFFESNKEIFSKFLGLGKGILILMQYHLAISNTSFDILSKIDFPGLENTKIITRQNNDEFNSPIRFDEKKFIFDSDNLIFNYPRNVLEEQECSFFNSMKNNRWQTGCSPLFACISEYPENDFYSIIDYNEEKNTNEYFKESFCIISRNPNKRVIITSLALDLEENYLLENLISYIAKGNPTVFFQSCGKCAKKGESCDFIDLLNNTKIHFSENEKVKNIVKYQINSCDKLRYYSEKLLNEVDMKEDNIIPLKQITPIGVEGVISKNINVSAIKYMCKLGGQYLKTQLKNGKYGSLIGTYETLLLFKELELNLTKDDKKSILDYLKSHNKDKHTFDAIKESTYIAYKILKLLNYTSTDIIFDTIEENSNNTISSVNMLIDKSISFIAKILGNNNYELNEILVDDDHKVKEFLLVTFAKIISSKDVGKISWENDCFMTSLMLIVLLKIERWILIYDKKYESNSLSKINIITSFFEEATESSLSTSLVHAADSERSKAHTFSIRLLQEEEKNKKLILEIDKLKKDNSDFDILENRVKMYQTITIILFFFSITIIILFVIIILNAHLGNQNIYDFIMSLGPIDIILSLASIIVVPFTIGTIFWKKGNADEMKNKKK